MHKDYISELIKKIDIASKTQENGIKECALEIYNTVIDDKIVHIFGTGHSHLVGVDLYAKAGGLVNINAMLDSVVTPSGGAMRSSALEKLEGLGAIIFGQYKIDKGDLMIVVSNSGRNPVPIDIAILAKEKGLKVIVITSLSHSKKSESRHKTGQLLYEFADIVLDNKTISGDCALDINGISTGSMSTIVGMALGNAIMVEAIDLLTKNQQKIRVFGNNNSDGSNSNEQLTMLYKDRIKHL